MLLYITLFSKKTYKRSRSKSLFTCVKQPDAMKYFSYIATVIVKILDALSTSDAKYYCTIHYNTPLLSDEATQNADWYLFRLFELPLPKQYFYQNKGQTASVVLEELSTNSLFSERAVATATKQNGCLSY